MQKLVLIDVAVCAALILVAACAMVLRWRRRRMRRLVWQARRGTAAGPYGGRAARREAPLVPGLSAGIETPDPAMAVPAERDRLVASRAGQRSTPGRAKRGRAKRGPASGWPTPGQAPREVSHEPGPRGPSMNLAPTEPSMNIGPGQPGPEPGRANPAGEPDHRATGPRTSTGKAGPLSSTEKIDSYYAEADRAMSDYLTERGWPKEPDTPGADGS
jgi:hypothetical protein